MIYVVLLLTLALQRGFELVVAASNTAQLRRQGAQEIGRGHYPVMVALHLVWFLALLIERAAGAVAPAPAWVALGWALLLWGQGLRWWTITTLGRRWSTRILVLPGAPAVSSGPFRLVRHPNYLGVIFEIIGVPLIGGCWRTLLVMGALHGAFLIFRMGVETKALRDHGCLPPKGPT